MRVIEGGRRTLKPTSFEVLLAAIKGGRGRSGLTVREREVLRGAVRRAGGIVVAESHPVCIDCYRDGGCPEHSGPEREGER